MPHRLPVSSSDARIHCHDVLDDHVVPGRAGAPLSYEDISKGLGERKA